VKEGKVYCPAECAFFVTNLPGPGEKRPRNPGLGCEGFDLTSIIAHVQGDL